ncbi:hypothetical protein LLE87_28460, partial [Paenibacillus polymyxa]|nr:hypothetical protein [Paenibacillus polymyxa]
LVGDEGAAQDEVVSVVRVADREALQRRGLGSEYHYESLAVAILVTVGSAVALSKGRTEPRKVAVPVIGTIVLAVFSYWLEAVTDWRLTIFGAMILFVVYYLPDGIVGFVRNLFFSTRR